MAGDSNGFYDFAELFGSELLSDVTLVLTCGTEADRGADKGPPAKRQRRAKQDTPDAAAAITAVDQGEQLLPGHGVVLMGCSPVFKAELARWRQQEVEQHNNHPRITLRVDNPEELEAAHSMVQFMYQQRLPESASQQLLVTLLQLADRFQVQKCTAACAAALSTQELSDETLEQVLRLPPLYTDLPLFAGVWEKAADKLQQLYGDLEQALAEDGARECLLALPLKGIELLLGDARTKVAYENTALAAATLWVQRHNSSLTAEQRRHLAQLIRIPHLTPFFGSSVALLLPWLVEALGINTLDMGLGIAQAVRGSGAPTLESIMSERKEFDWPESWALGRRPVSARKELRLEWRVSVQQLEAVFAGGEVAHSLRSPMGTFGGYTWRLRVDHEPLDGSTASLGIYLLPGVVFADNLPQSARAPMW